MRFTNQVFKDEEIELNEAVNILSVKVARSDVGFPIHVYGTVIARDSIDEKRVYLFHRDREHCQIINSKVWVTSILLATTYLLIYMHYSCYICIIMRLLGCSSFFHLLCVDTSLKSISLVLFNLY